MRLNMGLGLMALSENNKRGEQMNNELQPTIPVETINEQEIRVKFFERLDKLYTELQGANIDQFVSTKANGNTDLTYLSWGAAVDFMTKACGKLHLMWTYYQTLNKLGDDIGYEILTDIVITDAYSHNVVKKTMTLPCMDNTNKALKDKEWKYYTNDKRTGTKKEHIVEPIDSFSVNKNKQRCLVKAMTLFGLGLSLYMKDDMDLGNTMTGSEVAEKKAERKAEEVKNLKARFDQYLDKLDVNQRKAFEKQIEQAGDDKKKLIDLGVELKKVSEAKHE